MTTIIHRQGFYIRVTKDRPKAVTTKQKVDLLLERIYHITGFSPAQMRIRSREREIVEFRQLAMYISCRNGYGSLNSIGFAFGGFDHSSVIHARDTVTDLIESNNQQFMIKYNAVKHLIK